jgi:hypothetical protein
MILFSAHANFLSRSRPGERRRVRERETGSLATVLSGRPAESAADNLFVYLSARQSHYHKNANISLVINCVHGAINLLRCGHLLCCLSGTAWCAAREKTKLLDRVCASCEKFSGSAGRVW